jgi:hypothetical protein
MARHLCIKEANIVINRNQQEDEMKIGFAPKTVEVGDGTYLHFWYANNKGRGNNNCTIARSRLSERAWAYRLQDEIVFACCTSSWRGNVNFSKSVQRYLGL